MAKLGKILYISKLFNIKNIQIERKSFESQMRKNDESRYGDVTNLSVFSILYAMMV